MYIKILIKINLARQNINGVGIQLVFMHNVSMMNRSAVGKRPGCLVRSRLVVVHSAFGVKG